MASATCTTAIEGGCHADLSTPTQPTMLAWLNLKVCRGTQVSSAVSAGDTASTPRAMEGRNWWPRTSLGAASMGARIRPTYREEGRRPIERTQW